MGIQDKIVLIQKYWSHIYFSVEKLCDPDSARQPPSFRLGPQPQPKPAFARITEYDNGLTSALQKTVPPYALIFWLQKTLAILNYLFSKPDAILSRPLDVV